MLERKITFFHNNPDPRLSGMEFDIIPIRWDLSYFNTGWVEDYENGDRWGFRHPKDGLLIPFGNEPSRGQYQSRAHVFSPESFGDISCACAACKKEKD